MKQVLLTYVARISLLELNFLAVKDSYRCSALSLLPQKKDLGAGNWIGRSEIWLVLYLFQGFYNESLLSNSMVTLEFRIKCTLHQ